MKITLEMPTNLPAEWWAVYWSVAGSAGQDDESIGNMQITALFTEKDKAQEYVATNMPKGGRVYRVTISGFGE